MDKVKQKIKVHLPLDTAIMLNNLFDPIRVILCQIIRQSKEKHKTNFLSIPSYGNINWIYTCQNFSSQNAKEFLLS